MVITIEINSCKECPHFKEERYYSPDSFEAPSYDWYCMKLDKKKIRGYVEWHEESKVKIPDWCPFDKTVKDVCKKCITHQCSGCLEYDNQQF